MLNIYVKVTFEKKWRTQNFDFLILKRSSPDQFLGSSNLYLYNWIFKIFVATEISEVWEQNCIWFSIIFILKEIMTY